jgi:hypothetical protein
MNPGADIGVNLDCLAPCLVIKISSHPVLFYHQVHSLTGCLSKVAKFGFSDLIDRTLLTRIRAQLKQAKPDVVRSPIFPYKSFLMERAEIIVDIALSKPKVIG